MNKVSFIFALMIIVILVGCSNTTQTSLTRQQSISSSTVKITVEADLYPPIMHSVEWEKPVPVSNNINTAGAEDSPFITPDGNTMYFFFTPNPSVPAEQQVSDGVTGIYVSQKHNGNWEPAQRLILQKPNKLALDGCLFRQSDEIWFCSAREGYTGVNFFTAQYKNGKWEDWQYVGDKLKKQYRMGEMHITSDNTKLFFHSDREGGKGQFDIWVSEKENNIWQEPTNVAVVNSTETDGWPFVSQDEQELWFTRTYLGTPAIYRSKKVNGQYQSPELIVSQFAGEPTLDNDGNLYFVHHYYKNNEMLEADIYVAKKKR